MEFFLLFGEKRIGERVEMLFFEKNIKNCFKNKTLKNQRDMKIFKKKIKKIEKSCFLVLTFFKRIIIFILT